MSEPNNFPDPAQEATDDCTQQVLVSSDNWQETVDLYELALGKSPSPDKPPKAVFDLGGGNKLCVIQTDEEKALLDQTAKPAFFLELRTSQLVKDVLTKAHSLGAKLVIPYTPIEVRSVPQQPGGVAYLFLGSARLPQRLKATAPEAELGFIHNPNW
ncbi:hypothetical protein CDA63_05295 [Hymenobacter amundsenii]|uniref:VOC domain-containing protein n=1 Tax=Hymenobacter amundsenii TaxID=2006685 RepID=A0A246FN39_9BACT|nr:hypothetical protein [Hymenobacter amundsenii]OWP64143.1 hypothetical protein CDA63_05295 [Hymenobacter amundsenii]